MKIYTVIFLLVCMVKAQTLACSAFLLQYAEELQGQVGLPSGQIVTAARTTEKPRSRP